MHESVLIFTIFLVFAGAAVLSTFALFTRQSLLVAYMLLGIILGPFGFKLVANGHVVRGIGDIGIIFLLFLLGLNLPPQKLIHTLRKVSLVALLSSVVFLAIGYGVASCIGLSQTECWVVGAAMMFSSTIIGIKLLPTTVLHHQHTGEVMIGVLLLQDLIAIAVLLLMHGATLGGLVSTDLQLVLVGLPGLLVVAFFAERYVLRKLLAKFNKVREYMFLLAIAWCMVMAELSSFVGLSAEIGAFIAGVSLASSPISLYISESLRPVRDFFLVLFFFSVGASFNLNYFYSVIIPALVLALLLMVVKPVVYRYLLGWAGEDRQVSWEVGFRLAQLSEFSLIIAYVGLASHLIAAKAGNLIQAATIITFVISSYLVVSRYPTPMALSDKLRRD